MTDYTITRLDLSNKRLTKLPADLLQYTNLQMLYCNNNQLTELHELPASLEILKCDNNQLTELPELPASLQTLSCSNNQLTTIPELPASLQILWCSSNKLTELPLLPASLEILYCYDNLTDFDFPITIKNRTRYNQWLEERAMQNPVFK